MVSDAQKLRDAYKKAPQMVRDFITSPELSTIFTEIRTTHKLHLDEAGALSDILNAVFLELLPYEKFPALLKEALEQNSDKYDAVLKDVNEKVFTLFRKKLTEPQETPPAAPAQPPVSKPQPEQPTIEPAHKKSSPLKQAAQQVVPPQSTQSAASTPNKLESSVRSAPQEVEIKNEPQKNASYAASADPYREPIE